MNTIEKLESELGFVITCLFSEAISRQEFQAWLLTKIETHEDLPMYFFDLMDFDDALAKIYQVIGHVPSSNLSSEDERAIDGIAYARGITPYEKPDKMLSLEALKKNKRIKERFCDAFPKINLDEGG